MLGTQPHPDERVHDTEVAMSFLHVCFMISFPFTVIWHDLDLKHQNYLQRNISEEFHYQYVNLIIYSTTSHTHHRITFKDILSHLAEYSKNTNKQCSQVQDGRKLFEHLAVPCGKITIRHEHSFPLHYEWMIHTWQSMILNISLFEINIPAFEYQCVSNFLLLTEPEDVSCKQIVKLCGRSQDKIFYSTRNSLTVQLEAITGYEDMSQLLLFQYQVMSQKALSFTEIKPKQVLRSLNLNLQLLHFVSYSSGFVFFYNTQLSKRFLVRMSNNSTECNVLIYDGPGTRSPLLKATINHQGRLQYKSTLYLIAVYFVNITASYAQQDCFEVHILSNDTTEPTKLLITSDEPLNMSLKFSSIKRNVYHKLEFQTSSNNVNVKLQPFTYTGRSEAACYLGGIIFFSSHRTDEVYGPFCGELGENFLSINGLSLSPQPVTMILYLFADRVHSQVISFGLIVKNEPCIGILNPCNMKTSTESDGVTIYKNHNFVKMEIDFDNRQIDKGLCYNIQLSLQTYRDEACVVVVTSGFLEKMLQVAASMYYDRYQARRCSNCTHSNMKVYRFRKKDYLTVLSAHLASQIDDIVSKKPYELLTREETVRYNDSALQFVFIYSMTASIIDEAFIISILPQTLQHCTSYDLGTLQLRPPFAFEKNTYIISGRCSSTTMQYKSSHHILLFSVHPRSTLSLHIKFQNPHVCHNDTYVPFLRMKILTRMMTLHYILSWYVYECTLDWTVANIEDQVIMSVFIRIFDNYRVGHTDKKEHVWNPQLLEYSVGLNQPVECQELLDMQIQHEISHIQEHSLIKRVSPTYCVHSSCYYIHVMEHTSWTDAFDFCHKQNHHLLTINSDFEARVIKDITNALFYKSLRLSQVVFLNLKKSEKVCIY